MQTDTIALLPAIHVLTLVLADQDGYGFWTLENSREAPSGSRRRGWRISVRMISSCGAASGQIVAEVGAFVDGLDRNDPIADRVLATILFTDIVDSSAHASASGDRQWHSIREQHDAVTRAMTRRHRAGRR